MEWHQFFMLMAAYVGTYIASNREIKAQGQATMNIILSIKDEIKDFHGRLCALEEKYRGGK